MKTAVKKLSDTRAEVTVTLDAKDLKPLKDKALEKLAKEVNVEGFRKGKVPIEVAKKFIPDNDLDAEIVDAAIRATILDAFNQNKQRVLPPPSVKIVKDVPGEVLEYTATADVLPEIKLGDYKKLGVKKPEVKVTEKEIKEILDEFAMSFAEKKTVKRAAAEGDEVIIDFVGKKDGEAFQGGSAKDFHLTLGSKTLIPGFEDGIVGHEPGDKFDLKLTFPKDYGMKDLAGAKTVFEILIKQINEVKKPKLTDEIIKQQGAFSTVDELKEDIKKNLAARKEHDAMEKYKDALIGALIKKSKIPTPEILVTDNMKMIEDDLSRNAASHNMSPEEFLKSRGTTMEEWEKDVRKIAEDRVKVSLALQTIAVDQKISVPDEAVDAKIAELLDVYGKSPDAAERLKSPEVKMNIRGQLALEKAIDFLVKENS